MEKDYLIGVLIGLGLISIIIFTILFDQYLRKRKALKWLSAADLSYLENGIYRPYGVSGKCAIAPAILTDIQTPKKEKSRIELLFYNASSKKLEIGHTTVAVSLLKERQLSCGSRVKILLQIEENIVTSIHGLL